MMTMKTSDRGLLHGMYLRVWRALDVLEDVQLCHQKIRGARVSRILHPDMIQLTHIVNQLREMQRYWNEVLDMLEREEMEEWTKASLRDISDTGGDDY